MDHIAFYQWEYTTMNRHARTSSASRDNRAFREAIATMRQELLESQAETQRAKDQLNCLIMLVRRAWSGDQAASVHVANIAGVAPPIFQQEAEAVTAVYKSKAVHHWAMLTVGLLNQHYSQLEEHALALAKKRLQQRQDFLDVQLHHHTDILNSPPTVPLKHHQQAELKKPSFFLTNPGSYQASTEDSASSLVEFLYPGNDMKAKRTEKESQRNNNKSKLFAVPDELSNKSKTRRPVSAQHLKKADAQRARPRSAVVKTAIKGERPLKYETTRPLSGKTKSQRDRGKSDSPATKSRLTEQTHPRQEYGEDEYSLDSNENEEESERAWKKGPISMEDSVAEELRNIKRMEEDFKKTTKLLQQKLGISNTGAV
ncbi:hypothetical protein BSL78_19591 [Apostichopus japonicus]|uniref:Uncharacterized protein n=1 Tax=Stichopus japonicus TaxID=307972 RepID=A0A2G8K6D3_STIJA|nr:hypothetical protein BSL78_19591 [Apostichopus japonicus]